MQNRARVLRIASLAALIVCGILLMTAADALAQNQPRQHDRGFFLRMSAGIGSASTGEDFPTGFGDVDLDASGLSGDANFAIGAIVSPNLALHATLMGWSVVDPDVEIGGIGFETDDVTMSLSGFGAGLTYYVHPANIYFSGSVCAATLELEARRENTTVTAESDTGVAFDFTVGKEWWVGDRWGLGLAGDFGLHSIPDAEADGDLSGTNFGVRFSATYN
ncbi:MAG: hypothetical protein V1774_06450 [Candidatus Eisenbacteria bacterium]